MVGLQRLSLSILQGFRKTSAGCEACPLPPRCRRVIPQALAADSGPVGSVTLTNAAVAHGVQYVMQSMPDALKRLHVWT
jgi:hypothetical protein